MKREDSYDYDIFGGLGNDESGSDGYEVEGEGEESGSSIPVSFGSGAGGTPGSGSTPASGSASGTYGHGYGYGHTTRTSSVSPFALDGSGTTPPASTPLSGRDDMLGAIGSVPIDVSMLPPPIPLLKKLAGDKRERPNSWVYSNPGTPHASIDGRDSQHAIDFDAALEGLI